MRFVFVDEHSLTWPLTDAAYKFDLCTIFIEMSSCFDEKYGGHLLMYFAAMQLYAEDQ